jgi:hypothetical protein
VPLQTHGDETPNTEKEIEATLRPDEHYEEDCLSVKVPGLRFGNQAMQKVSERGAQSGREDAHHEH